MQLEIIFSLGLPLPSDSLWYLAFQWLNKCPLSSNCRSLLGLHSTPTVSYDPLICWEASWGQGHSPLCPTVLSRPQCCLLKGEHGSMTALTYHSASGRVWDLTCSPRLGAWAAALGYRDLQGARTSPTLYMHPSVCWCIIHSVPNLFLWRASPCQDLSWTPGVRDSAVNKMKFLFSCGLCARGEATLHKWSVPRTAWLRLPGEPIVLGSFLDSDFWAETQRKGWVRQMLGGIPSRTCSSWGRNMFVDPYKGSGFSVCENGE